MRAENVLRWREMEYSYFKYQRKKGVGWGGKESKAASKRRMLGCKSLGPCIKNETSKGIKSKQIKAIRHGPTPKKTT